jgi:hypothetical protein
MTNNLPCITLPPALQGQLEVLAASFGVDEEHAIERCFELAAQLIAIKQKQGGELVRSHRRNMLAFRDWSA